MQRIISIFTSLILCGVVGNTFAQVITPAMFNMVVVNNTGVVLHQLKLEDKFGHWCVVPPKKINPGTTLFSYCTTSGPGTMYGVITYNGADNQNKEFLCLLSTRCDYAANGNGYSCFRLDSSTYSTGSITCSVSVEQPSAANNLIGTATYTIAIPPATGGKK